MSRKDVIDSAFDYCSVSSKVNGVSYPYCALIDSYEETSFKGSFDAQGYTFVPLRGYPKSLVIKLDRQEELNTSTISEWHSKQPLDIEIKDNQYKGSILDIRLAQTYYDDHIVEIALEEKT